MKHSYLNPFFAGLRCERLECATSGGEVLVFGSLKSEDGHVWEAVEALASDALIVAHPLRLREPSADQFTICHASPP